jgi:Leucine-rich repeat (LRR) protein
MNNLSALPDSIGKISSLASLELSDNRLASLPGSLGQLSGLASLGLRSNCLAGLLAEVGGLSSLSYLDISMNHVTVSDSQKMSQPQCGSLHALHAEL